MARVVFKATKEQIELACALAANAALPAGLGWLQYDANQKFDAKFFNATERGIDLGYVQGR